MPNPEIDLGDGIMAEIDGADIILTDDVIGDSITMNHEQFGRLSAFVAEHGSKT